VSVSALQYEEYPNVDFTLLLKYNLQWLADMQIKEGETEGNRG